MSNFHSENLFGFDHLGPSFKFSRKHNGDILSLNNSFTIKQGSAKNRKLSQDIDNDLTSLPLCQLGQKKRSRRYSCKVDLETTNSNLESNKSSDLINKHISTIENTNLENLSRKLQKTVQGSKNNKHLQSLINNPFVKEIISDRTIKANFVLIKEVEAFIRFEKNLKRKRRVRSNFSLIDVILQERSDDNASVIGFFTELSRGIGGRFGFLERKRAIGKYLAKKERRKDLRFIRYHVRKELACKRLRHRGKFIKKPKVDLEEIAREFNGKNA